MNAWPDFSFRDLQLSRDAKSQLAGIYEPIFAKGVIPPKRTQLLRLLCDNSYDPEHGTYVPLARDQYLVGKLPQPLTEVEMPIGPFTFPIFCNALVVPEGCGSSDFKPTNAPKPVSRITNGGYMVVTFEHDGETMDQFEETLEWTRASGGSPSPLCAIDRALCRFRDYRGYSVVFSGGKSLHYHFIFALKHIESAPADRFASERLRQLKHDSALIANVHKVYWDRTNDIFAQTVQPSLKADTHLCHATQYRRSPFGIRILEKSSILGVPAGTAVPQLVIAEEIRTRAPTGSEEYCVSPTFSLSHPVKTFSRSSAGSGASLPASTAMIQEAQEWCRQTWGDYPELVIMMEEHGEWVLHFRNHPADRRPSTFTKGEHRRLKIVGGGHSFTQKIFLPDRMTAQEFGDHFAIRFGMKPPPALGEASATILSRPRPSGPLTFEDLRAAAGTHYWESVWRPAWDDPIWSVSEQDLPAIQQVARTTLARMVSRARMYSSPIIIQGGEGMGKTTVHLSCLHNEAFNSALNSSGRFERFAAFAFRSRAQAEQKAEEFRTRGYMVIVVKPFWEHYREACSDLGETALPKEEFDEIEVVSILDRIREEQPAVYDRLEEVRRTLWSITGSFDGGLTILVMTHKAAACWRTSRLTRTWYHPEFDSNAEDDGSLAEEFKLDRVLFDDPEPDDFLHVLTEARYEFIKAQQEQHSGWRHKKRSQRVEIFRSLNGDLPEGLSGDFEAFDELMRLDLCTLDRTEVDCDAIPFGYGRTDSDIYRGRHEKAYFIGPKPWLSETTAHMTLVTTESLVTEVIDAVLRKRKVGQRPIRIDLTRVPGLYPIKVPTVLDLRAAADRGLKDKRISALADEIRTSNENAIVISDGTKKPDGTRGLDGVLSFQRAKGQNGLEDRDVYVIVTCPAPDKYAELNVLGRWLGRTDVIGLHYQDQIDQAVGRNRGFRQASAETKTVVVTSPRLWNNVLKTLRTETGRALLYAETARLW